MLAFLIDPFEETITPVEYSGNYNQIYVLIEAELFDCVRFSADTLDTIYVDDEGLFKKSQAFFMVDDFPQPLAGKGLVLGTDEEGQSIAPKITLEELKSIITFIDPKDVF